MKVTAQERRTVLKLLNVSEAARQLGVGVQRLHRDARSGRVRSPEVCIGRRLYYSHDDMKKLSNFNVAAVVKVRLHVFNV